MLLVVLRMINTETLLWLSGWLIKQLIILFVSIMLWRMHSRLHSPPIMLKWFKKVRTNFFRESVKDWYLKNFHIYKSCVSLLRKYYHIFVKANTNTREWILKCARPLVVLFKVICMRTSRKALRNIIDRLHSALRNVNFMIFFHNSV